MKKFLFAMIALFIAFSSAAADFKEGVHYYVLDREASAEPRITEFFSFACPACYSFDQVEHISDKLRKLLPENGTFQQYHVVFLGGREMGPMLTKAWSVAITLKIEEKIKPLMFNAVHYKKSINGLDSIRNIFLEAGVKAEEFDSLWNSFLINSLTAKQIKESENYKISATPSIVVNGKYLINNRELSSVDEFTELTNYLLNKNK